MQTDSISTWRRIGGLAVAIAAVIGLLAVIIAGIAGLVTARIAALHTPTPSVAAAAPPVEVPAAGGATAAMPAVKAGGGDGAIPVAVPAPKKPAVLAALPPLAVAGAQQEMLVLSDPGGEYTLDQLSGRRVTVKGAIHRLRVRTLNAKAVLDAWGLQVDEVVFVGPIDGGSKVLVRAPGGRITFTSPINDKSTVDVEATGGVVTFANAGPDVDAEAKVRLHCEKGNVTFNGTVNGKSVVEINAAGGQTTFAAPGLVIDGSARVTIAAKDVRFAGQLNGERTDVAVTLSDGGSLKFGRLDGSVRMRYGKSRADDAEPAITRGEIAGRAKFGTFDELK